MSAMPERLHFIDNFRSLVVVLVVCSHTALCYMMYSPPVWYMVDSERSIVFTVFVIWLDIFLMASMFFVAGYFLRAPLDRDLSSVVIKKVWRLALPLALGVVFLCPPIGYLFFIREGVEPLEGGLFEFWTDFFWRERYQQGHLWFLGVLFVYSVLGAAVLKLMPVWSSRSEPDTSDNTKGERKRLLIFFMVAVSIFFTVSVFFSYEGWHAVGPILLFQPVRVIGYLMYFGLGYYAYRQRWFEATGYQPNGLVWGGVLLVMLLLYIPYRIQFPDLGAAPLWVKLFNALIYNAVCIAFILWCMPVLKRFLNFTNRWLDSLAACSFGIYFWHNLFVFGSVYVLLDCEFSIFLKFPIVVSVTVACSWAATVFMRRIPVLNRVF